MLWKTKIKDDKKYCIKTYNLSCTFFFYSMNIKQKLKIEPIPSNPDKMYTLSSFWDSGVVLKKWIDYNLFSIFTTLMGHVSLGKWNK